MPEDLTLFDAVERFQTGTVLYQPVAWTEPEQGYAPVAIVVRPLDEPREQPLDGLYVTQRNRCLTRFDAWMAVRPLRVPIAFDEAPEIELPNLSVVEMVTRFGLFVANLPGWEIDAEWNPPVGNQLPYEWTHGRAFDSFTYMAAGGRGCSACDPHPDHAWARCPRPHEGGASCPP